MYVILFFCISNPVYVYINFQIYDWLISLTVEHAFINFINDCLNLRWIWDFVLYGAPNWMEHTQHSAI